MIGNQTGKTGGVCGAEARSGAGFRVGQDRQRMAAK